MAAPWVNCEYQNNNRPERAAKSQYNTLAFKMEKARHSPGLLIHSILSFTLILSDTPFSFRGGIL